MVIQGIKMLSLKLILVVWKGDYWTQRFLQKNNNFPKDEGDGLCSLKDDPFIIIKSVDKASVVVMWSRED